MLGNTDGVQQTCLADGLSVDRTITADIRILRSIRKMIRAIDLHSKKLSTQYNITTPQLVCLQAIMEDEPAKSSRIAKSVSLSAATVIGILDRLEGKELVQRVRSSNDRRVVHIWLTQKGRDLMDRAPSPLQDKLAQAISALPKEEQHLIAGTFDRVVDFMEAGDLDAAPMLAPGSISPAPAKQEKES